MSLKAWKKEFYSTPADKVSKKNAVAHSLKKWQGLTKANLKKHGVRHDIDDCGIEADKYTLSIDCGTCALCKHHYDDLTQCATCPLAIVRGKVRCDSITDSEAISPFSCWRSDFNPAPMIRWLKKALKAESKA